MATSRQNKTEIMNALENSLLAMMKERQFRDISIRDLCDRAGVGRSSFYRYYDSTESVLSSYLVRLWYAWLSAKGVRPVYGFSLESSRLFVRHVYEHKELFSMIFKNGLERSLILAVDRNLKNGKMIRDYGTSFFVFGVFGMLKDWWRRGCVDSPEVLIDVLEEIFTHAGE